MSSGLGALVGPIHIEYTKCLEMPACARRTCGALMRRVVSQVDAHFSNANSTAFWSVGGSEFFKVVDVSCCFSRRCFLVSPPYVYLCSVLPSSRSVIEGTTRTQPTSHTSNIVAYSHNDASGTEEMGWRG